MGDYFETAREDDGGRSLLRLSLWRLMQIMSSGGFAILFTLIYTKKLSKVDYAAYGITITLCGLLTMVANFGLRQTVNRFVAKERGAKRLSEIRGYIRSGVLTTLGICCGTVALVLSLSGVLTGFYDGRADAPVVIVILALSTGFSGLSLLLQGILEGFGEFKRVMLFNFGVHAFQLVLIALLLLGELTVVRVLAAEAVVQSLGMILFGLRVRQKHRALPPGAPASGTVGRLLRFGFPIFLNALGGFLYTKVDVLFVKHFLGPAETADYFLMMYIFNFPLQALGAYIFVLNTEISVCVGEGRTERIRKLFARSEKVAVLVGAGLAAVFAGASYGVAWVLPEYGGTASLMRLIAPLILVKCVAHIASGAFMISLGRVRTMAVFTVSGGILNMALNFVFIPPFGVNGAVYSTLLGHTLVGITVFLYVWRALRRLELAPSSAQHPGGPSAAAPGRG